MPQDVLATVIELVRAYAPPGTTIDADTPLLEIGVLDSASMVNVLLELESRLGVVIGPADLSFDHFQDCRLLAETLTERISA
jgi:acyl carrier protein